MTITADRAAAAYDTLAPDYDALTAEYCHDLWLSRLEDRAIAHGLHGHELLDAACGTGKSFLPLARRGYRVTAFDISEEMVRRAQDKAPDAAIEVRDLRDPGVLGSFDLVTCLDDALNYLVEPEELEAALRGLARNLAPGGVVVFDLNTLAQYRTQFATDWISERDGRYMAWHGETPADLGPGATAMATVDVFAADDAGGWLRSTSVHHQRHWPREVVEGMVRRAGLTVREVLGQQRGAVLEHDLDEDTHIKAVYVATASREEDAMTVGGI